MKWIGAHIWKFISRFHDDVYFENISNHGADPDTFLSMDVDTGKVTYRTGAEVLSDIGAGNGDITGVTITTDSGGGSAASDTGGSADFSILGANGVGVTNSGTTITAAAVPGEIDHDSLLNFAANEHFTQANITTVGTIGTGVWQGTAIASAYLDSDTAHLSTQKHITHHSFTADIDTTKTYVGMVDADSESTGTTGIDMPLVFPVASKLLQVTLRSNKNLSALTYTWRLETQATGVGFATGPTIVGTQSGSGPAQTGHTIYDFTTSLDSGDNVVDAFDAVYLSLQSSGSTANTKYYVTCVWETDMSGY